MQTYQVYSTVGLSPLFARSGPEAFLRHARATLVRAPPPAMKKVASGSFHLCTIAPCRAPVNTAWQRDHGGRTLAKQAIVANASTGGVVYPK